MVGGVFDGPYARSHARRVCVKLQLLTALPPLVEWISRGQPAHTPPQRPSGAEKIGRHQVRKRTGRNSGRLKKEEEGEKKRGNGPEEERSLAEKD
eukprot:189644-Chlamydomonas_euryale.AAC.1